MTATTKFGTRLRELRTSGSMTQEALASEAKCSQGQLSKLERGEAEPTPEICERLTLALGVNPTMLLAGTEYAHLDGTGGVVAAVEAPGRMRLAYFASALTGLSESMREEVFRHGEIAQAVCEEFSAYLYRPAQYTDPVNNPEVAATDVYAIDRAQVARSDMVILHCGRASFGAGQELEIATQAGISVILLIPNGTTVSRMVHGSYARLRVVRFDTDDELREGFQGALRELFNDLVLRAHATPGGIGERVRVLRNRRGLTLDTVAVRAGLTRHAIERLEREDELAENPSVTTLRRLADTLGTSVSYLTDGIKPRLEDTDDVIRRSKLSFDQFVRRENIAISRVESVWRKFQKEYVEGRQNVADARAEPATDEDWERRFNGEGASQSSLFEEDE
jgi:transcriptional regulator with XRE-family HTH domain